jgi:hypothetical protein
VRRGPGIAVRESDGALGAVVAALRSRDPVVCRDAAAVLATFAWAGKPEARRLGNHQGALRALAEALRGVAADTAASALSGICRGGADLAQAVAAEGEALRGLAAAAQRDGGDGAGGCSPAARALSAIVASGNDALVGQVAATQGALEGLAAGLCSCGGGALNAAALHAIARVCRKGGEEARLAAGAPGTLPGLVAALQNSNRRNARRDAGLAMYEIAAAAPDLARRIADEPGALRALAAALPAGGAISDVVTLALAAISGVGPDLARRVGAEEGVMDALFEALRSGGEDSADVLVVLCVITVADADLARRAADAPGVLSALAAAARSGGYYSHGASSVLADIALAGPDMPPRLADEDGMLRALAAAAELGGGACASWALLSIARSDPALTLLLAKEKAVMDAMDAIAGSCDHIHAAVAKELLATCCSGVALTRLAGDVSSEQESAGNGQQGQVRAPCPQAHACARKHVCVGVSSCMCTCMHVHAHASVHVGVLPSMCACV